MLPSDPVGRALVQLVARDRYERWLVDQVNDLIAGGLREIAGLLTTRYATLTPGQLQRKALLFRQMAGVLGETYGNGDKFLSKEMRTYASLEAHAALGQFKALVASGDGADVTLQNLTRGEVKAIAEFPIAGLNIGEWFEKQASDMNAALRGQIQIGLLNGESAKQIVAKRILPDAPTIESPGVIPRSRSATLALVRTTTTTVQTHATFEGLKSIGAKFVSSYRYVAVRDARTTPICRALDGRVFRFDDPKAKRPPQHVNCRSTIVAVADYKAMGIAPPNTTPGGFTMGSYAEWLRSQPESMQNLVLGKAGTRLFRDGKASLADLVNADGTRMTSKALAATYGSEEKPKPIAVKSTPKEEPEPAKPPRLPAHIATLEQSIRTRPVEYAAAWDADGNVIIPEKRGKKNNVTFSAYETAILSRSGTAVLTHNHPNGSPLSHADNAFIDSVKLAELRAVGIEPGTNRPIEYSLVRKQSLIGAGYVRSLNLNSLKKLYNNRDNYDEFAAEMKRLGKTMVPADAKGRWSLTMEPPDVQKMYWDLFHAKLEKFHKREGVYTYTRRYTDE